MSEPLGWRRGDQAAWWDAHQRRWRMGTLTSRVTVTSFDYEVRGPDGVVVVVPEAHLRSPSDPAVLGTLRASQPPTIGGETLAERTRRTP